MAAVVQALACSLRGISAKDIAAFDPEDEHTCHYEIDTTWIASTGASVQSTPIITDLRSDGSKEIIVSTVRHYVEALEGVDGTKEPGMASTSASSSRSRTDESAQDGRSRSPTRGYSHRPCCTT